jgi:hypothetical protein
VVDAGRFEDEFVNQRLRQLQNWVDRMCKHAVIAQSDVFRHFLTCTDEKVRKVFKRYHCAMSYLHLPAMRCMMHFNFKFYGVELIFAGKFLEYMQKAAI